MAKLVLGVGASHTTLMNTQWEKVDHLERAHRFRDALKDARAEIAKREADLAIVVGSNHFRGHWLDLMAAFCVGVGEVTSSGEHGSPAGSQKSSPELGRKILNGLAERDFDAAFSTGLVIDHGISHAIQWLTGENRIPIVPIMVNCFAPPLPSFARCLALGGAIREICLALPERRRIVVIGSGGLSHRLPFPDWRNPVSDNDRFFVDSWKYGRGNWEKYEKKRRAIIVNAPAKLNEAFDRSFLDALCGGSTKAWASRNASNRDSGRDDLSAAAGNGANEIRTWLVMHAAMGFAEGRVLAYSPMPEWLTGMGVFATA